MARLTPRELLLTSRLAPNDVAESLAAYGFKDPRKADANLEAMAEDPRARQLLAEIANDLLLCFSESVDPDQALTYFERFTQASFNRLELFSHCRDSPWTMELLAKTFGASPFMAEILIRDPGYLYWIADPAVLRRPRSAAEIEGDLVAALKPLKGHKRKLDLLRIFKRKEILHVGVRDLLRLATVEETLAALSVLAEVLIELACQISHASLQEDYGLAARRRPSGFCVIGLGKLGGGELNFSSDVDLLYVYESDEGELPRVRGKGGAPVSRTEYFAKLARRITSALSEVTGEGCVYRVDLRLRPEGKVGPIASSLDSLRRYYADRGRTWERLAMLKAWPVAGDRVLGAKFLTGLKAFVYSRPFNAEALREVKGLKARIDQKIASRGEGRLNVKLGFGGIREIEFVIQTLQLAFAQRRSRLKQRNSLAALPALSAQRLLSEDEASALTKAYRFLRDVENKLQMVHNFQVHSIPSDPAEVRLCALRLGYRDGDGLNAESRFGADLQQHTEAVNRIFEGVLDLSSSRLLRPA